MKVSEAMHKGAEWVGPDTAVADVARKMRDLDVGAIPVGENDRGSKLPVPLAQEHDRSTSVS